MPSAALCSSLPLFTAFYSLSLDVKEENALNRIVECICAQPVNTIFFLFHFAYNAGDLWFSLGTREKIKSTFIFNNTLQRSGWAQLVLMRDILVHLIFKCRWNDTASSGMYIKEFHSKLTTKKWRKSLSRHKHTQIKYGTDHHESKVV